MTLQDCLDELRAAVLRDATTLKGGPSDHYWSDDSLVRYLNDAHIRFARLSLCIRDDSTPALTQVTLVGDGATDTYVLDPSVLMVVSARHQDDTKDLVRITHKNAINTQNTFTESFEFASNPASGKPTMFLTDEAMNPATNHAIRMRMVGMPLDQAGDTETGKIVYLRTIRKPLTVFTLDDLTVVPEIPEEYHLDMLEWGAWRALRNIDIDAEDRTKAKAHKDRFEEAVAECKEDVRRKMWSPLSWRFGQNGFTYCKN